MKLINILENLINQSITSNFVRGSDFEDYFESQLIQYGYESIEVNISRESKNKILTCEAPIINSTGIIGYKKEPFGTQSFPDFLLFEKNYVFSLELKSSQKTDKPMWNNSLPRQHGIYVFMAYSDMPERRETLIFMGKDVISEHAYSVFKSKMKAVQEASKFTKEELAILDTYNYGWEPYVRANYQQTKHSSSTVPSFVDNPNKNNNNRKVIDYLNSMI